MADCFTDDWYQYVIDYTPLVHIGIGTETTDVATLRAQAIDHIWTGGPLPSAAPDVFDDNVDVSVILPGLLDLDHANLLTFNMAESQTADVYVLYPTSVRSANKLVFFIPGHGALQGDAHHLATIKLLLNRGCTVAVTDMPGYGFNDNGTTHDGLAALTDAGFCGLSIFLEPIHRAITYLGSSWNLIAMIGFSGGGWVTTLCAALDERIDISIPTAGTYPEPLRHATGSPCTVSWDWEQGEDGVIGPFYGSISYEDLYIMACSGGRRQVQAINRTDSTLAYGTAWKKYAGSSGTIVQDRATALGGGSFEIYQYVLSGHDLTQDVRARILTELGLSSSVILTDSFVAHWPLDEASGNAIDAHDDNDGTDVNTVTSNATGGPGGVRCRVFTSASSENFTIVDNADLSVGGDNDLTLAGWTYLTTSSADMTIGPAHYTLLGNQRSHQFVFSNSVDEFRWNCSGNGTAFTQHTVLASPADATWYFVVLWHNALLDTLNSSVNDAAPVSTAFTAGGLHNSTGLFRIGARAGAAGAAEVFHNGRMWGWGMWKRLLTTAERTWLYNAGVGRTYAEIVAGPPSLIALRRARSSLATRRHRKC